LETGQASPAAVGMQSCVGIEYVPFSTALKLIGKVEVYLQDVIDTMCSTLKDIAGKSLKKFAQFPRTEWLRLDCSQCTLLVGLANWVINVEAGFAKNSLPEAKEMTIGMLNDLIKCVQDSTMPKDVRMKVMCLITMDAHSRDIIGDLIEANCTEVDVF
jgi:dynein heavy chain